MALALKLTKTSISADGTTMLVTDSTGNYNVTTNVGGYGSPNAARNSLALILLCWNERYDGEDSITPVAETIAAYTPTTVTEWTVTLNSDGWQQAIVYGVKLYSTSTLFAVNEIVYNVGTSELWRILTVSGSGPYTYTHSVVLASTLTDTDYVIPYTYVLNDYAIPAITTCFNKSVEYYFLTLETTDFDRMLKIDAYLKSIRYSFLSGSFAPAQAKVEQVQTICSCFTSECNC